MNTAADLSDLTLNDTQELLSPLKDRSNLSSVDEKHQYSCRFEDEEFHTTITGHRSSNTDTYTNSDVINSPQLASTYRQQRNVRTQCAKQSIRKVRPLSATSKEKLETTAELINSNASGNLSIWENWLIDKVKQERENMKKQKEEMRLKKEKEEMLKQEREEKREKAEKHYKEWCEENLLKTQMKKQCSIRAKKLENEIRKSEQDRKETRSQQAYLLWLEKKDNLLQDKLKKQQKEKAKFEKEKKEREIKNKEKFDEWIEKVKQRPSSPLKGNQGIITEYPEPSFKNPAPWIGPLSDKLGNMPNENRKTSKPIQRPKSAKNPSKKPVTSTPKQGFTTMRPSSDRGVLIMRPLSSSTRSR